MGFRTQSSGMSKGAFLGQQALLEIVFPSANVDSHTQIESRYEGKGDDCALIQVQQGYIPKPDMSGVNDCNGYRWSQGQYVVSNCSQESSTFFIVLGFTLLVLVLLLFIIVVIACVRRQRLRIRARQSPPLATQENEDDCVIDLDGLGPTGEPVNGRNLENVKAVIMAGEEKPTYIAHPVPPSAPGEEQGADFDEASRLEGNSDEPLRLEGNTDEPSMAGVNSDEPSRLAVVRHEED